MIKINALTWNLESGDGSWECGDLATINPDNKHDVIFLQEVETEIYKSIQDKYKNSYFISQSTQALDPLNNERWLVTLIKQHEDTKRKIRSSVEITLFDGKPFAHIVRLEKPVDGYQTFVNIHLKANEEDTQKDYLVQRRISEIGALARACHALF